MTMYSMLIADDEERIRMGLTKLMKQDSDIASILQAEDGEEALALATQQRPDIMLVDINMPFMNGLEFIEKIRAVCENSAIIVITGYDEFEYAQKALRLGVSEYLLKPVQEEALREAVAKAKTQLTKEVQQSRYLQWARLQVESNRPVLVSNFLNGWLDGRYSSEEVEEQLRNLTIDVPDHFGVTVAKLTILESQTSVGEEWDEDLVYYAAENIGSEIFQPMGPVCCKNSSNDLVILSACPEQFAALGRRMQELLEEHLPVKVVMEQGSGAALTGLPDVYADVMEALHRVQNCSLVVLEAKRCVERAYGDPAFSLQRTAEQLHVSPQYLSRSFRHEIGITFVDYLTRTRIRKAVELLDENLKIYEIAERVGYSSQHYFSSAFKRVLGISPQEYRKEN